MYQLKDEMDIVYRRYYGDVYRFCLSMCDYNESIAEEITQNSFFKAINSADSFRGDCKILTWLCRIARNDYISYLRKEKRMSKKKILRNYWKIFRMRRSLHRVRWKIEN